MTRARYLHELEQLGGELRDVADDFEAFLESMRKDCIALVPLVELRAKYEEFVRHTTAPDAIDRLRRLAETMQLDGTLSSEDRPQYDLIVANKHAWRLCDSILTLQKLLLGLDT